MSNKHIKVNFYMMTSDVNNILDKLYVLGLKNEWCKIVHFNKIKKTRLN